MKLGVIPENLAERLALWFGIPPPGILESWLGSMAARAVMVATKAVALVAVVAGWGGLGVCPQCAQCGQTPPPARIVKAQVTARPTVVTLRGFVHNSWELWTNPPIVSKPLCPTPSSTVTPGTPLLNQARSRPPASTEAVSA